jgi:hypothetical protein
MFWKSGICVGAVCVVATPAGTSHQLRRSDAIFKTNAPTHCREAIRPQKKGCAMAASGKWSKNKELANKVRFKWQLLTREYAGGCGDHKASI